MEETVYERMLGNVRALIRRNVGVGVGTGETFTWSIMPVDITKPFPFMETSWITYTTEAAAWKELAAELSTMG